MKGKKILIAMGLMIAMASSFAACGGKNQETANDVMVVKNMEEGLRYRSKNVELNGYFTQEAANIDSVRPFEDGFLVVENEEDSSSIVKYIIKDNKLEKTDWEIKVAKPQGVNRFITLFCLDADGNVYAIAEEYPEDANMEEEINSSHILLKFGKSGELVTEKKIDSAFDGMGKSVYINNIILDGDGNICCSTEGTVLVLDQEGELKGKVTLPCDWIMSMICNKEGKILVSYYERTGMGVSLSELDLKNGSEEKKYDNFPFTVYGTLNAAADGRVLTPETNKLSLYDLNTGSAEDVLSWMDCDINGEFVRNVYMDAEGNYVAFSADWNTNTQEIYTIRPMEAGEEEQVEKIVLASLYEDQDLQAKIVAFNKSNDKYRVELKTYIDMYHWDENAYDDGVNALNADIVSSQCPDLIDLQSVDYAQLQKQDVFEDLTPYINNSANVKLDDFLPEVVEEMKFGDKQISIPGSFSIRTLAGKTKYVGEKEGWTRQEFMDFANSHPDQQISEPNYREYVQSIALQTSIDSFIDMEKGQCNFESQDFKDVLTFLKGFPKADEFDYATNYTAPPLLVAEDKLLLIDAYMSNFTDVQLMKAELENEPVTFKGYPGCDGNGTFLEVNNAYAIASNSTHKDAAWAFLEFVLNYESNDKYGYGFASKKSSFEKQKELAMEVKYVKDSVSGEIVLDDKGEPMIEDEYRSMGFGGMDGSEEWVYEYRAVTEDEVEIVERLLAGAAKTQSYISTEILNIIMDEVGPFYDGQKSVDEVAAIIQNRVSLYMMENR